MQSLNQIMVILLVSMYGSASDMVVVNFGLHYVQQEWEREYRPEMTAMLRELIVSRPLMRNRNNEKLLTTHRLIWALPCDVRCCADLCLDSRQGVGVAGELGAAPSQRWRRVAPLYRRHGAQGGDVQCLQGPVPHAALPPRELAHVP